MRLVWVLLLASAAISCNKKKDDEAPRTGSGSAVVSAPADAGTSDAAPAVLAFEPASDDGEPTLAVAFDRKIPRLPAVSEDGASIATFNALGGGPMSPQPMEMIIAKVPSGERIETLPLQGVEDAVKAEEAGSNWATPAITAKLKQRGSAALARLRGFHSLEPIKLTTNSNGEPQPTKIGDVTLVATSRDDDKLIVELKDGNGKAREHEQIAPYTEGTQTGNLPCTYEPDLSAAYRDPASGLLYIEIGFHWSDECEQPASRYVVWGLQPDPIRTVVTSQFDLLGITAPPATDSLTDDATIISSSGVIDDVKSVGVAMKAMDYGGHDDKDVQVTVARDGKSAWASELATVTLFETNKMGSDHPWRASNVLVNTPRGWRIAALAWTEPRGNAVTDRDAKAGKLKAAKLEGDPGDASLRAAFAKLTTDGVDATASARTDLVAIGSAPGERTVGGAVLARAWNAAWKGKATIVSSVARVMPSGTTGWVASTVELARKGYKTPFLVFAVFDKAADGTWTLVHIQFAV